MLPRAREELFSQPLGDELMIFDANTYEYHHLNKTASLVWRHCDGETTISQLTDLLRREISPEIEDEVVLLAVRTLEASNLIDEFGAAVPEPNPSRRAFLEKVALASGTFVAATVVSMIAPTAAQAQSSFCSASQPCCW